MSARIFNQSVMRDRGSLIAALLGIVIRTFMKRSINCAFGSFFLIASLFCGQIWGQTTTATQAVGDPPGAGGDSPQTQPPTAPRTIRTDETFVIGNDDVLAISVWNEPNLTKQIP